VKIVTERASYVPLTQRGLITVSGEDARPFLQGLISNDIEKVSPARAIYAALLTPQGKFLHDFLIARLGDALVLDCERDRLGDLGRRLAGYRLKAKIALADATEDYALVALIGADAASRLGLAAEAGTCARLGAGIAFVDPRDARLGARAILPIAHGVAALEAKGFVAAPFETYERLRLSLGVPDGSRDMAVDKATLLENNFEALNGVDFAKGCYVGQELTARTKYRGLIKRRLMAVRIEGPLPPAGAPLMLDAKEAGEMRSGLGERGLALIRLDRLAELGAAPLVAGASRVFPLGTDEASA
jgi:folate-binding protein YgfZ